jgi:hypothetical protein
VSEQAAEKPESSMYARAHPFLYHYTSQDGLKGILGSNSLWATYFADLNDSQEIHEVRTPLVNELGTRFQQLVEDFGGKSFRNRKIVSKAGGRQRMAQDLARRWVNALYTTTFNEEQGKRQSECCIASFCSHAGDQPYERDHGLLSQWRGYGKDGGYSLVFDAVKLEELIAKERSSYFFTHLGLYPAYYHRETLPTDPHFEVFFRESKRIIAESIEERDPRADQIYVPFVTAATTTKHRGFYEEREVRIVAMPATQFAVDRIKHLPDYHDEPLKEIFTTEKDDRIRHHTALFGKRSGPLPIIRIIVGPSRQQEANAKAAETITEGKIPIVKSATPFLG